MPLSRHYSERERTGFLYPVLIHASLVFAVALLYLTGVNSRAVLVLGGAMAGSVFAYIGILEAKESPLWFTPISYYFLWHVTSVGLSPMYLGLTLSDDATLAFSAVRIPLPDLVEGYVVFLCGTLAMHCGLRLFRPPSIRGVKAMSKGRGSQNGMLLAFLVGLVYYVSDPRDDAGSVVHAFRWLAISAASSYTLGLAFRGASLAPRLLGLTVMTAVLIVSHAASGSKAFIMYALFPVGWMILARRPRLAVVAAYAVGLALFYIGVVSPIISASRLRVRSAEETPFALIGATASEWWRDPGRIEPTNSEDSATSRFFIRQFDAAPTGFFVGEVRSRGSGGGESLKSFGIAFIPRFIWRDKPRINRGEWFNYYLGMAKSPETADTSTGMTVTGDLYWNFGIIGVGLGMFVIGCLIAGLAWRLASADPTRSVPHMLLYVTVLFQMPNMGELVTLVPGVIAPCVIVWAWLFIYEAWRSQASRRLPGGSAPTEQ